MTKIDIGPNQDGTEPAHQCPAWFKQTVLVLVLSHGAVLGLGGWLVSTVEHLPDAIVGTALIGIILHWVAVLRRDRSTTFLRAVGRAILGTLACVVVWLLVFWLVAAFTTASALLFGLMVAPVLGIFTSGLLTTLGIGRFGRVKSNTIPRW